MQVSGWFLHVEYRGMPDAPPPVKELRKELDNWLASQDANAIGAALKAGEWGNLPRFEWQRQGLSLAFTPSPKSQGAADNPDVRPIGVIMGEPYQLNVDKDIKKAVEAKAKKYGNLSLPLVVAVNVVSEHCDDIDIKNALFGTETILVNMTPDGSFAESGRRLPDGVWFGTSGPRSKAVSAVLIGDRLDRYTCAIRTPILIHHPYPTHGLELPTYSLPESIPDKNTHTMTEKAGKDAKEFLRLPDPWPPTED